MLIALFPSCGSPLRAVEYAAQFHFAGGGTAYNNQSSHTPESPMLAVACEVEWRYVQTSQQCDVPANQVAEIGHLKIASANSRVATCSA